MSCRISLFIGVDVPLKVLYGLQVVAVGIWLSSYVVDWLHELELGARYCCPLGF